MASHYIVKGYHSGKEVLRVKTDDNGAHSLRTLLQGCERIPNDPQGVIRTKGSEETLKVYSGGKLCTLSQLRAFGLGY